MNILIFILRLDDQFNGYVLDCFRIDILIRIYFNVVVIIRINND